MNNKTKNIVLIIGFLLSLFICYKYAFKNTIEYRSKYSKLKSQEQLFENTPRQLTLLKQKKSHYDSILSKYQLDGTSIQNNLLKTINSFAKANSLKVKNFVEPHISTQNDLTVKTYQFTLEGDYDSIIKLIHQLEQQTKYGEIINLHFEKKKDFRTRRNYLLAKVLLKSFG